MRERIATIAGVAASEIVGNNGDQENNVISGNPSPV